MLRIHSLRVFTKWIFILFLIVYMIFKIFHYFYPNNYCNSLSGVHRENSIEDLRASKICVNTLVCELGNVSIERVQGERMKTFTCIRKIESGVWKW